MQSETLALCFLLSIFGLPKLFGMDLIKKGQMGFSARQTYDRAYQAPVEQGECPLRHDILDHT